MALVAAGAAATLLGPATAGAATVKTDAIIVGGKSVFRVNYNAGPGENNFLTISESVDSLGRVTLRLNDNVPIVRDSGCDYPDAADRTILDCGAIGDLVVRLADGDNVLRSFSGSVPMLAHGFEASRNDFNGGPGKDNLLGGNGRDILIGGSGDDNLNGLGGDDSLVDGFGNDVLSGGDGNDTFHADAGADTYNGQLGNDTVSYRLRRNAVKVTIDDLANDGETSEGDNVRSDVENVEGGAGNDEIVDHFGRGNAFLGGPGNDKLAGGAGEDQTLVGGPGDDAIDGGPGNDMLFAGPGQDGLKGGTENDLLFGEDGGDTLDGGPGADTMAGGAGFDIVSYQSSTQRVTVDLDGQAGDDGAAGEGDTVRTDIEQLVGGPASDILTGNASDNLIIGLDGNDVIDGGLGADTLLGGNDNDTIRSRDGVADRVDCGPDSDQFDADAIDIQTGCEAKAAPAVGIGPKRVRVDDRGRVKLTLHCWASSAKRCTGTLRLKRRVREKDRILASRRFSVASGDTAAIRVRLAGRARRALARSSMKVRAVTRATDASGHVWSSRRTLTLRR